MVMRLILLRFIIDVIYCFGRWWAMNGTIMEVSLEELLLNPLLGLLVETSSAPTTHRDIQLPNELVPNRLMVG